MLPAWTPIALGLVVAAQRLGELAWSRRLERAVARRPGALAESRVAFGAMFAAHAGLVVLPPLEAALLPVVLPDAVRLAALGVFLAAQCLRYWAIRSLGPAWNVRARVTPELGVSTRGPYRWIRHPNYLAVLLEFAAVPVAAGSPWSALLLNAVHTPILLARIRREEALLASIPGYARAMAGKGRFFPRARATEVR